MDTELVLSLISIAFFESYFLVLGSILESNRNEKVFNSIALKNRPIAMIKGICSNADVRNLYFKENIRNSNKIFECAFFWVKSCFDIVDVLFRKQVKSYVESLWEEKQLIFLRMRENVMSALISVQAGLLLENLCLSLLSKEQQMIKDVTFVPVTS